jgi:hypothetical protein
MKSTTSATLAFLLLAGIAAPAFSDEKITSHDTAQSQRWSSCRAKSWDTEHKTWVQRGGYSAYRVPDTSYTMYFGPEHTFRISTLPYRMNGTEPAYQYNGYWLTLVDPWPENWSDTWYNTDDVYVTYDNGYYLYNRNYPDVGLALKISK